MANTTTLECEIAQDNFLRTGGVFTQAITAKIKSGEMQQHYTYREYPKMIRLFQGEETVKRSTETIRGQLVEWEETRPVYHEIVVNDEAEEERVLAGGKTSAEMEEERDALYRRCLSSGIKADPAWSIIRLRRELGEKLDEAPKDDLGALKARLAELEEIAVMKARIAELEAMNAAPVDNSEVYPDEANELRAELKALGIKVDMRWGADRLREELDRATAAE